MHPNRAFAWNDRDEMLAFIADTAFCTLFVGTGQGGHVLHVPVVAQTLQQHGVEPRGTNDLAHRQAGKARE